MLWIALDWLSWLLQIGFNGWVEVPDFAHELKPVINQNSWIRRAGRGVMAMIQRSTCGPSYGTAMPLGSTG